MSVTVRAYRKGGWMVDINTRLSNGTRHRERRRLSISSKSAAQRWGVDRERHLLQHGRPQATKEVPTLAEFATRFMDGHARANRQKPSGIAAKETIFRVHLVPLFGTKKLDAITNEAVQGLKHSLRDKSAKTVNNVLTVLSKMLRVAVEWDVLDRVRCNVHLLPIEKSSASFHDFDEFERLVQAAKEDRRAHLIVLMGGDAGLRCGEMMALEWQDVDFRKRQLTIQRSDWKGHVTTPKSGRLRHIPLTVRLEAALRDHRHLKGPRVLCSDEGSPLTQRGVQGLVRRAARRARLDNVGLHVLRHTFCSHLAMRGAPTRAIQELAGHAEMVTTQRYMHLSPAAIDSAIRLLDQRGNIVATPATIAENVNN